jgi:hypothetical protein
MIDQKTGIEPEEISTTTINAVEFPVKTYYRPVSLLVSTWEHSQARFSL